MFTTGSVYYIYLSRFPKLLVHTYNALQSIKTEAELIKYYDKHYDFVKVGAYKNKYF